MSEENSEKSALCQTCQVCEGYGEPDCYNCYTCQINIGTPEYYRNPLSVSEYERLDRLERQLEESERKRREIEAKWSLWALLKHILTFKWLKITFKSRKAL